MSTPIRVTVWGENVHEQKNKVVAEVYPKTMHGTIAEFLKCLAANLEAHVPTIDTSDPNGQEERAAYLALSTEYEAVAAQLALGVWLFFGASRLARCGSGCSRGA